MSSANLELFPEELFARKGTANPAYDNSPGEGTVVPMSPSGPALRAVSGAEPSDDARPQTDASDPPPTARKKKKNKRPGKDQPPPASVLAFRLLDEAKSEVEAVIRYMSENPGAPAAENPALEGADTDALTIDFGPQVTRTLARPEEERPELEQGEADTKELASVPPAAEPASNEWRWAAAAAVLLVIAAGSIAGWYYGRERPLATNEVAVERGTDTSTPQVPVAIAPAKPPPADPTQVPLRPAPIGQGAGVSGADVDSAAPGESASETSALPEGGATAIPSEPAANVRVDVVRVEEDGSALIAGMAAPFAELIVLHNGEPIGVAKADAVGQWILMPEVPLGKGEHEISLVMKAVEERVTVPASSSSGSNAAQPPAEVEDAAPAGAADSNDAPASAAGDTRPEAAIPEPRAKPRADVSASQNEDVLPPGIQGGEAYYVVQLASAPSAESAQLEWVRLQKAFPDLLGDRLLVVQKADLSEARQAYRVRTGPFAERADAQALCSSFQSRSQDCLVVKRWAPTADTETDRAIVGSAS